MYIWIFTGYSDFENITDILNEIKTWNLNASLKSNKYVYWNNLDELLQRFAVLYEEIQSKNANTTLKNEVIRIL